MPQRIVGMVRLPLLVLLSLLSSCDGGPNRTDRRDPPQNKKPYLHLPVFVDSQWPLVKQEYFSPATGSGLEPVPEPVRELLLPADRATTSPPSFPGVSMWTLCWPDRLQVLVERSVLGYGDAHRHLRLGTCPVSERTTDLLQFEYDFHMCGTSLSIISNRIVYSNTLRYDPPKLPGPIRRAVSFTLPVNCSFNRHHYSYKVGYTPRVQMRKVFKQMTNGVRFILTPRNARWERLSPSDYYVLGRPMYFEAEALSMSNDARLYVHSCYVTPEKSHTSTPQFPVVKNFGCMVESKDGRSRFIRHQNNAVRFSVDAFLFRGMTERHLYMHCNMSVDSSVPTPTAKSCNYNTKAKRWVELFGSDSVCTCCDSSCDSAASTVTQIISSKSWTVQPKVKPTTSIKRKTGSMKTTTTTTTTTIVKPKTTRQMPERRWTSRPAATPVGEVGVTVREQDWQLRGEGVMWVEEEDEEKQVKGSAVVEEEEEKEEDTEPHRIFEEFFIFDK